MLVLAVTKNLNAIAAIMALGFLIGAIGHLINERTMIVTGILIIGMVSAYVIFVPGSG